MTKSPCHRCGSIVCAALCLAVGGGAIPGALAAQASARPTPVSSTTVVAIGDVFVTVPMQPMLVPTADSAACGDARCFRGLITVRANQRWQLQVRLTRPSTLSASVAWRPPVAGGRDQPLDGNWMTVIAGPIPTAGTDVALQFTVRPDTRVESNEPLAQLVSLAVQYRVVPLP